MAHTQAQKSDWIRATKPNQKNQREVEILTAAKRLLKKNGYEGTSLNTIAKEAQFTKSNVYRYFSSREEIFLNVYMEYILAWSKDMLAVYPSISASTSFENFASRWIRTLSKHPNLLELSSVLFVSLEKNSSKEQLEIFKQIAKEIYDQHYQEISRVFPFMTWNDVRYFLKFSFPLLSTFWISAKPHTTLSDVYQKKAFQKMKPQFAKDAKKAVVILLSGIQHSKGDQK